GPASPPSGSRDPNQIKPALPDRHGGTMAGQDGHNPITLHIV
ncbi:MAG: hypothetical protein V7635_1042, partial [Arthrobacter sp.]